MGSSQTTTQNNKPYEAAQPLIDQGLADAQRMYEAGGFNISPYQGRLVAETDPFKTAAYGMAPQVAGGMIGGAQAAQQGLMRAMDPNMRSAAFDQVRQNTIDAIAPQINSAFAGSGMTGSTLHAQNLAKGLSAGLGAVENDAYQMGEQRALAAAGMVPGINQAMTGGLDYLRDIGGERQQQSQAEIQADVLRDQQEKTAALEALQQYLSLGSQAGSAFGVQSATQRNNPGLMGMLGFGLQAAPLLFPSDRRLKTDIEPIGKRNGWKWYRFKYVGRDEIHEGVMADEVRQVLPEAVIRTPEGYDMVDYSQLGVL